MQKTITKFATKMVKGVKMKEKNVFSDEIWHPVTRFHSVRRSKDVQVSFCNP